MIVAAMFLAIAPPPLSLEPFMDEEGAGRALEEQMACLGSGAFDRRRDPRDPKVIAAEIVVSCREKGVALRTAMADVFKRKPNLLPVGKTADEAAASYASELDSRVEFVIVSGREHQ